MSVDGGRNWTVGAHESWYQAGVHFGRLHFNSILTEQRLKFLRKMNRF